MAAMQTYDRQKELVEYFGQLRAAADGRRKQEHAKAIEETLLHRCPALLPQFLDDVLHLASEPSPEVKAWVVHFIDKLLDTPHIRASPLPVFTKLGQTLLYLLSTDQAPYLRRAVAVAGTYLQKLQPFLIKFGRDPAAEATAGWQKLWAVTAKVLRDKVQRLVRQSGDADRSKAQCYAFLRDMALLYSPRPADDQLLDKVNADGTTHRAVQRVTGLDEALVQGNIILKAPELTALAEATGRQLVECLYEPSLSPPLATSVLQNLLHVCQQRPHLWRVVIPRLARAVRRGAGEADGEAEDSDDADSDDAEEDEDRPPAAALRAAEARQQAVEVLLELLRMPATKAYRFDLMRTLNKLGAYDRVEAILRQHLRREDEQEGRGKRERDRPEAGRPAKVPRRVESPGPAPPSHGDDRPPDDEVYESELGRLTVGQLADLVICSLRVLDTKASIQVRHQRVMQWVHRHRPGYRFDPAVLRGALAAAGPAGLSLKAQLQQQQEDEAAAEGDVAALLPALRPPPLPPHLQRPAPPPTPPGMQPPPAPPGLGSSLPPPRPPTLPPAPGQLGDMLMKPPPLPPSLAPVLRLYQRKFGISKQAQHQCQRALLSEAQRQEVIRQSLARMMQTALELPREGPDAVRFGHAVLARLVSQSDDDHVVQAMLAVIAADPRRCFDWLVQWLYSEYHLGAPFRVALPVLPPLHTFLRGPPPAEPLPPPTPEAIDVDQPEPPALPPPTTLGSPSGSAQDPMVVDVDEPALADHHPVKPEPVEGEGDTVLADVAAGVPLLKQEPSDEAEAVLAGEPDGRRRRRTPTPPGSPERRPKLEEAEPAQTAREATPLPEGAPAPPPARPTGAPHSAATVAGGAGGDPAEAPGEVMRRALPPPPPEEKPTVSVGDPIGWLFCHSKPARWPDEEWVWKGEGPLEGEPTRYSKLLDRVLTELQSKLEAKSPRTGNHLLTDLYLQAPFIPLSAFQRLHFDYCMAQKGTERENLERMAAGLMCLEALIKERPAYSSKALSMVLYYSSSQAQTKVQITAVRLIANRLFEDPRLQDSIVAFAKHSLQRLVELRPPAREGELDDAAVKRLDGDVQRLVSLCLGLCMKNCALLKWIFVAFTKSHEYVAKRMIAIEPFAVLIERLAERSKDQLVKLTGGYPKGAETVALKVINLLMERDREALRPIQAQMVRAAKYIYKERTAEQDVRFLIPVLAHLTREEVRGRVLELILKLPRQLMEVAIHRLLVGSRFAGRPEREETRITGVDLIVFLHEMADFRAAAQAIEIAFERPGVYNHTTAAQILSSLIEMSPLPILLMRTLLQCLTLFPKLADLVSRYLSQLIQKNIWENDVLWKGFRKCVMDYRPRTFPAVLMLPQKHQVALLMQEPALVAPFHDWLYSPGAAVNKHTLPADFLNALNKLRAAELQQQAMRSMSNVGSYVA